MLSFSLSSFRQCGEAFLLTVALHFPVVFFFEVNDGPGFKCRQGHYLFPVSFCPFYMGLKQNIILFCPENYIIETFLHLFYKQHGPGCTSSQGHMFFWFFLSVLYSLKYVMFLWKTIFSLNLEFQTFQYLNKEAAKFWQLFIWTIVM